MLASSNIVIIISYLITYVEVSDHYQISVQCYQITLRTKSQTEAIHTIHRGTSHLRALDDVSSIDSEL